MSLQRRFVAASSTVLLLASTAAFSAVWFAYDAGQEDQLDAALVPEAERAAREASHPSDGPLALDGNAAGSIVTYEAIYDARGQAIAWTSNLERARPRLDIVGHPPGAPFDFWWNNEHLRGVLAAVPGGAGRSLLLATPRTDIDGDARDLARRMAAAVLIAAATSAAVTWWLVRRLTRDHDRIATVARAVAGGDLSARIRLTSTDPEMARLGRDLDEMIARLAVLLETQQLFIANAAHELRSPIAAVLGELSLALRREREPASYRESIEAALGAARSLNAVADDLLALARIGGTGIERERVPLAAMTRATVDSTRDEAGARGVGVHASADGSVVEGRSADLTRLLRNLVENAIRHTPMGGSVRIDARSDSENVLLEVTDDGPGVRPEVRERIFEPFFRADADCAHDTGAGLGLAIARSIAQAHGGDLNVGDSTHGARFVVRLPLPVPRGAA